MARIARKAGFAGLALTAFLAACSQAPRATPAVQQWTVMVANQSEEPAVVFIGVDVNFGDPLWKEVGAVVPAAVPPMTTARVVMTPPPPGNWAIFVNPGPERGPLLTPRSFPAKFSGELPGTIVVRSNGLPEIEVWHSLFLPSGWCDGGSHLGCP
jgi:hypothetical protein